MTKNVCWGKMECKNKKWSEGKGMYEQFWKKREEKRKSTRKPIHANVYKVIRKNKWIIKKGSEGRWGCGEES